MKIVPTKFEGCFMVLHDVFEDCRGSFFETFNLQKFKDVSGLSIDFVQDNLSTSKKGVLRGLHYQEKPFEQAKLVTVLNGEILDVVVDLRPNSKTYGEYLKLNINSEDSKSLFIPKGMAHGFLTLSEEVLFAYKCDGYYNPGSEKGIRFDDPRLNIDWEFSQCEIILSEKDKTLPFLNPRVK